MSEKYKSVREIKTSMSGNVIDVTHLASPKGQREFIPAFFERVLDIRYSGDERPPEVITFNGQRFVPEE